MGRSIGKIMEKLESKEWVSGERNYFLAFDKKRNRWTCNYASWLYSNRERYVTKDSLEEVVELLNEIYK